MPRRATPLILEELAFYDALETNDSAVQVLGDEQLRTIARELAEDGARGCDDSLDGARERAGESGVLVKRLLRRYGYPPDKQERATQTVLEQAELWEKRVGGVGKKGRAARGSDTDDERQEVTVRAGAVR